MPQPMQPVDYTSTFSDLPNPSKAVEEGVKFANDWKDRSALELKAKQAAEAKAVFQAKLAGLAENPTTDAVARMSLEYPELSENFKRSYDMLEPGEQQARLSQAMPVYAALQSGQVEIATKLLDEQAEAARNSGKTAEAKAAEDTAKAIRINPTAHKLASGMFLARVLGPKQFKENFTGIQGEVRAEEKAPTEQRKLAAEATTAEAKAKTAESETMLDLEKKGWDIKNIQNDIAVKRETNRISAMNAQISRETNQLKRKELGIKVDEAKMRRDEHIREKAAEAESALTTIDQSNEIITDLLSDQDTLKAITGASSFKGSIPGTKGKAMAGKIEQLQNTIASANLDKLKGAMSDKDIVFLKNIATSLDRSQDEASFLKELKRIQKSLTDSRSRVQKKYGVPGQGSASEPQTTNRNVTVDY